MTIVELMVGLAIGVVALIAAYTVYDNMKDATNENSARSHAKQMADSIIDLLSRDFIEEHQSVAEGVDKPRISPYGLAFKVEKRANSIFQTQCPDLPVAKQAYGAQLKKLLPNCSCFKQAVTKRPIIKIVRGPVGKPSPMYFPDEVLSPSIDHTKPFAACLWISNLGDSIEVHVGFVVFSSGSRDPNLEKFRLVEARKVFNLQAVNRFIRYR